VLKSFSSVSLVAPPGVGIKLVHTYIFFRCVVSRPTWSRENIDG